VPVIERRYGPGEQVYLRDDPDGGLRFVLSGAVRVYKRFGAGG
jgi:CRP-like cAMP-binding protein